MKRKKKLVCANSNQKRAGKINTFNFKNLQDKGHCISKKFNMTKSVLQF